MLTRVVALVRGLVGRRHADEEMEQELAFHIAEETRANLVRGMSPADARRAALRDLGGVTQTREAARAVRTTWADALVSDILRALRRLNRERRFALTAIVTLGLGIGSATAMFSVVHAVLLRPFGVDAADRVVVLWPEHERVSGEFSWSAVSRDLAPRLRTTRDVALVASTHWSAAMAVAGGATRSISTSAVSARFFDVLGAHAWRGRTFRAEDESPASPGVIVLSHASWIRLFGGDLDAIGTRVSLTQAGVAEPFDIIGVMAPDFFFPDGAECWIAAGPALARYATLMHEPLDALRDGLGVFYAVGRMHDGTTVERVRADAAAALADIARVEQKDMSRESIAVVPINEHIFGRAGRALVLLMGAVAILLLIACTNVAGLFVARDAARTRELAVCVALGATRATLIRQATIEATVIATLGAALGVAVAGAWIGRAVALSPVRIPRLDSVSFDGTVLSFSVAAAICAACLLTVLAGIRLGRAPLADLRGAETSVARRAPSTRRRQALVTFQVAATLVLMIAAGLCLQSLAKLTALDLGFDPSHVLTFTIDGLDDVRISDRTARLRALDEVMGQFERVDGVQAAGAIYQRPFEHGPVGMDTTFVREGQVDTPLVRQQNPMLNLEAITPHYFAAMEIPLIRGRVFTSADAENSAPVVVVSEAMAARVWPGQNPVGQRILATGPADNADRVPRWQTVVGVVATARYREIETPALDLYVPVQQSDMDVHHVVVRTTTDPAAMAPLLATVARGVDAGFDLDGISTMEEIVRRARGRWHFTAVVFSLFAAVAIGLASLGLFSLVAYAAAQRSREMAVRVALGATRQNVIQLLVAQAAAPVAAGAAIGLLASAVTSRMLGDVLFEIGPIDPATTIGALVGLVGIAGLATYVPARRASTVDPLTVLRDE